MRAFRPSPSLAARSGFSLIELMIAVAVLVVIVAIAVPSYQGTVRKSRRTEAATAINAVMQAQERYRTNNPTYAGALADIGQPATTPSGYYAISIDNGSATATGYTVTATAVAGTSQAADGDCARLRVRAAAGNLFYGSASSGGAWTEGSSNRCWAR